MRSDSWIISKGNANLLFLKNHKARVSSCHFHIAELVLTSLIQILRFGLRTRVSVTLPIRIIARGNVSCSYFAAVGRRERRWQLNYYRDMHLGIFNRRARVVRLHARMRAYARFVTGTIGQSLPPVRAIKPELIH